MNRFVASGLVLTVIFVVVVGKNHFNNVNVGLMMPVYDALSSIDYVKGRILDHHYKTGELPNSNQDIHVSQPDGFKRKSSLLQSVTVYPGGVVHAIFTSEIDGQNSEIVYRPVKESRYNLNWKCTSYRLTQQWQDAMHDICQIADTPFDYQQYAREAELEQKTDHYLAQVQQDQRQQSPKQPKTIDCPDLAHASNQFLHLSPTQFSVYKLPSLTKLGAAERPDSSRIPHWAVHDQNYAYLNNRLAFFDNQSSTPTSTNIHLPGASRFYRTADQLWSNMGAGLARIKLCGSKSKIQDKFLLDLGSYNALIDFYLLDKWALITSQQNHTNQDTSALQLVSLNTNRVFGFLKLKGNGYGVTGNQLVAFVANGSYGISVIDLYNPSLPKLVATVPTQDVAMDVKIMGNYLIVADRLAGLALYIIEGHQLHAIQTLATGIGAVQLNLLTDTLFSVTFRDGTTQLFELNNGTLNRVNLPK